RRVFVCKHGAPVFNARQVTNYFTPEMFRDATALLRSNAGPLGAIKRLALPSPARNSRRCCASLKNTRCIPQTYPRGIPQTYLIHTLRSGRKVGFWEYVWLGPRMAPAPGVGYGPASRE